MIHSKEKNLLKPVKIYFVIKRDIIFWFGNEFYRVTLTGRTHDSHARFPMKRIYIKKINQTIFFLVSLIIIIGLPRRKTLIFLANLIKDTFYLLPLRHPEKLF